MNKVVTTNELNSRLWPHFPGYGNAFGSKWAASPGREFCIDRNTLINATKNRDKHERCFSVVNLILDCLQNVQKLDSKPSVAICIIPDEVWNNCRPESNVTNAIGHKISSREKQIRRGGQADFFVKYSTEQYHFAPDFRRQLKARSMKYDIPIQIIRESTLRLTEPTNFGVRGLTPLSDRMWNLSTALYYKAGGKPWKLADARKGVCYIGIAFRRAQTGERTACCAAQMFLDSGDGIVFLGEYGPWYSADKKQFHLTESAAERLLHGALKTYETIKSPDDPPLKEIFLHSRSSIWDEEFAGYQKACPANCKIVGIRVRKDWFAPRLYRNGRMPVQRGTLWCLNNQSCYLYASGFKARIASYNGWEIPTPLRIDIQHGDASIELVAKDILSLTKLNYNACHLGDSEPVTVRFSDAVGEILISNPTVKDRRPNFKFYI